MEGLAEIRRMDEVSVDAIMGIAQRIRTKLNRLKVAKGTHNLKT